LDESFEPPIEVPQDLKVGEAKSVLMEKLFEVRPDEVFYERQIEVFFEDSIFHWITAKALHELVDEDQIQTDLVPLSGNTRIRFYWSSGKRSWKRKANAIRKLVREYSVQEFTAALGNHGEMMFDAALPRVGFVYKARDVRAYKGKEAAGQRNLDRVFERDGLEYGIEIKNTLDYIDRDELREKITICKTLGLIPLFIVRMMPKNYIYEDVYQVGGFCLLFKWQLYPHGSKALAERVHNALELPVDSPKMIADGTLQRLLKGHEKILTRFK